jgi:hypothetical protein
MKLTKFKPLQEENVKLRAIIGMTNVVLKDILTNKKLFNTLSNIHGTIKKLTERLDEIDR